jgi:hypothetical protein
MKFSIFAAASSTLLSLWFSSSARAVNGEPFIHDPSTVTFSDGK